MSQTKPRGVITCEFCGEPIPQPRQNQKYCKNSHRVMAHQKRQRAAFRRMRAQDKQKGIGS